LKSPTIRLEQHQKSGSSLPSNILEAIKRGQRNNYSYGRMTLEEMKAERQWQIGEGYEALAKVHPETVRNTVRDLD